MTQQQKRQMDTIVEGSVTDHRSQGTYLPMHACTYLPIAACGAPPAPAAESLYAV